MIFIFEMLIVLFLLSKRWIAVLFWVLSAYMIQISFKIGNKTIYMEVIEDYPIEDCLKPKRFASLYKKLCKLSYKDIPKEMYYCETIRIYGFIIYSIVLSVMVFIDEYAASLLGGIYLLCFSGTLSLLSAYLVKKKSFLARYKKLNRHNIKYLFIPSNQPYARKVGKCKIVTMKKRGSKHIVEVELLDSNEIRKGVLLHEKNRREEGNVYNMYVICNVFYIV